MIFHSPLATRNSKGLFINLLTFKLRLAFYFILYAKKSAGVKWKKWTVKEKVGEEGMVFSFGLVMLLCTSQIHIIMHITHGGKIWEYHGCDIILSCFASISSLPVLSDRWK